MYKKQVKVAVCVLILILQACSSLPSTPIAAPSTAMVTLLPATAASTETPEPTNSPAPPPTSIPLAWKQIYSGEIFRRAIITAITVDPLDPNVIYVGTKSAGIYKSIDGGLSWKPAQHGISLANVDTLVIDPDNSNIVYAGVVSAGVYKTTDGGENWRLSKAGLSNNTSKIIIDSTDGSHLYYTQGGDISQSKDGGESWIHMYAFSNVSLVLNPKDTKTLLAGGHDGKVYISHDEGATWALIYAIEKPQPGGSIELTMDGNAGDLILVNSPERYDVSSIYSSSDGGKTWVWRSRLNCETLIIHPDGKTIFCGATDGAIYTSTDAAQTWSFLAKLPLDQVRVITVSPNDPSILLAGGDGLYISFDGGQKWEERNDGLGSEVIELEIDPTDNIKLYGVDAGEFGEVIYRSLDQGLSWKFRTKNCKLVFGIAGNLICNQNENSAPAEAYLQPDSLGGCGRRGFAAVNPYRQGEFYLAGRENCVGIKISLNGGANWKDTNISGEFSNAKFFFATDQKTIYATSIYGSDSRILRATDDGMNWESCEKTGVISPARSHFAIDPNDSARIYLATRGEGVYISQDGCESWRPHKIGLENIFINTVATDIQDSNRVYAGTDSGAYVSFDFGKTWSEINNGLTDTMVIYSIVVDKDSNIYATTPNGIFQLESR